MASIETDGGRLRRLVERYFTTKSLRLRRAQIVTKMAKERAEQENAEINLRLDDIASITGLPKSHPDVLVLTARSLAADDRREREGLEDGVIDRSDVGYKAEFSFD